MKKHMSIKKQLLHDIFVTAVEGGINYWATVVDYRWSLPNGDDDLDGFYAVLHLSTDDGLEFLPAVKTTVVEVTDYDGDEIEVIEVRIDRSVLSRGYLLAACRTEQENSHQWQCGNGRPPLVVTDDTDWDFDALDADAIVQLGLFGKTIYG